MMESLLQNVDTSETSSDESEGYTEENFNEEENHGRKKREIAWCGVESDSYRNNPLYGIQHGPGNQVESGYRMQLYCKTGFHLAVFPDGKVRGVDAHIADIHPYGIMEISSAGQAGHIRIKALNTNYFVAVNKAGRFYGERDAFKEGTVFLEELLGSYNTYMSRRFAHLGWFIAISKSGNVKRGYKTGWGQNSITFLPRRIVQ